MPYQFFLSYTRTDNDAYLKVFYDDLTAEIGRRKTFANEQVSFLDQRSIELGADWEPALVAKLLESKVLVCLYSPHYFESEYCGKEWRLFFDRCLEHARSKGGAQGSVLPIIKPVIWIPPVQTFKPDGTSAATAQLPQEIDEVVRRIQYTRGVPDDIVNREGLHFVLRKRGTFQDLYTDFLVGLAKEIIKAGDDYGLHRLPKGKLPSLKSAPSAFPRRGEQPPMSKSDMAILAAGPMVDERPKGTPAVAGRRLDARRVGFVFVATHPDKLDKSIRSPAAYLDNGAEDWKPFYPADSEPIGPLVQNIVSGKDLRLTSDVLPFDSKIVPRLRAASRAQKIIVFIVDRWTLHFDAECKRILKDVDEGQFYNATVLVPSNTADRELSVRRAELEASIVGTFLNRKRIWRNPSYLREDIGSADELRQALKESLEVIRAEMRVRAEVVRPLPRQGPAERPLVSAAGST